MAQRTTIAAVRGLLEPGHDYDGLSSLQPFLDTATVIVDRVVTCAASKGVTLTAGELELIERWLAAHFYVQSDQTFQTKSTGGASGSHHGQTGMFLESSRYGQAALSVDYSGCLVAIASGTNRKTAGGFWLGRPPSEQTDYVDRS